MHHSVAGEAQGGGLSECGPKKYRGPFWSIHTEADKGSTEGGGSFDFGAYLHAQAEGKLWLSNSLEERTGMTRFVTDWLAHHKPGKGHPERTVKSFAFQEAESISRRAKVCWAARNGHAVLSLQHDGIVVAVKGGSDAGDGGRCGGHRTGGVPRFERLQARATANRGGVPKRLP